VQTRDPQACYKATVTDEPAIPPQPPAVRRAHLAPRLLAGAAAVAVIAATVGSLLLAPVLAVSADGITSGVAAGLALATPTPTPEPTATPNQTASPSPAPTPYPLMTPRTIIPPGDLNGYVWPLDKSKVTLPFGPTSWGVMVVNGQLFHDGLDITNGCGNKVRAAHDGVVLAAGRHYDDWTGWVGDLTPYYRWLTAINGWDSVPIVIVIDDGNGYRSIYAHEWSVSVAVGQQVRAGQIIGIEGASGLASGCHVHYSLYNTLETATFALDPGMQKRNRLPGLVIARTNPLLVLPLRCDVEEQVALRPYDAAMQCGTRPGTTQSPPS
jgi:murein DD-endopeptidase MepM/ murein hydrolase activator NlpD